jgi:hypothetical protein
MSKKLKPWEENGMSYGSGPNGERVCRGANMGRRCHIPDEPDQKLFMERIRFVDGTYDQGGAYWGISPEGKSLWCAYNDMATVWVRAKNRTEAKIEVRKFIKGARFYN